MHKRNAARPVLESMEDRLVLSIASALDPLAEVRSAIAALAPAHHSRDTAAEHSKSEGAGRQHHTTKAVHAVHHHSSTSSNTGSSLSNFFKSVFPGL
jgi:hypothetical protein